MRRILAELYERTVYDRSRENPDLFPECYAKWAKVEELGNMLPGMRSQCLDCCEDLAWAVGYESFLWGFTAGMEFLRWYAAEKWED